MARNPSDQSAEALDRAEEEAEERKRNLPLIGRERALIDALTSAFHDGAGTWGHEITPIFEKRRGNTFEVKIFMGGEDTKRIAKVTVELDRVESF